MSEMLSLRNLCVGIPAAYGAGAVPILKNINLTLNRQECVGIIGGSGSGKSVLMNAIIHSLRAPLAVTGGEVLLEGENLLSFCEEHMRLTVLGKRIASICPNPQWRLDPIDCVGEQIKNIYLSHVKCPPAQARERVMELLRQVGIPDPQTRYNAYPYELSGGMAQRVLVTIALICEPELLLADEPTGGLDVTIQIQVFNLIRRLIRQQRRSTIVASRDIGLIYHLCDRVYVLYDGRILESGATEDVIHHPLHPYTAKLVQISESDHKMRQTPQYRTSLDRAQARYRAMLTDRADQARDGYVEVGEGHWVEVSQ